MYGLILIKVKTACSYPHALPLLSLTHSPLLVPALCFCTALLQKPKGMAGSKMGSGSSAPCPSDGLCRLMPLAKCWLSQGCHDFPTAPWWGGALDTHWPQGGPLVRKESRLVSRMGRTCIVPKDESISIELIP